MRRAGWLDRIISAWLIFWLAFFAVYIHMGALGFAGLVILLGSAGWIVWIGVRKDYPFLGGGIGRAALVFAAFFLWLGLSSLWSAAGPGTAVRLGGQLMLTAAIPILLLTRSENTQRILSHILMAMALAGAAVLAVDVASGYGLNTFLDPVGADGDLNKRQGDAEKNIGRGLVVYALIAPLLFALFAAYLRRSYALAASVSFIGLLLIGTVLNRLAVAPIILLGAAPLFLIGLKSPRWGLRLSLGTVVASVLFAPIVGFAARLSSDEVMSRLPMSWDHRLRMWDYTLARIADAPLIGHGLDSSRGLQDGFTTRIGVDVPFVSLHPHNLGLQTWMEAGAVGAILLSLALASLYRPLNGLMAGNPLRAAAVSGLLMGTAIASAITVGAWQYWWWGIVGLSLALVILIPRAPVLRLTRQTD